MTNTKILKIVKEIKPTQKRHLKGRLSHRYVGSGAFRVAYALNKNIVIKFPGMSDFDIRDCIQHSQTEIQTIRRIKKLKKLRCLRKFIPKIFYMDYKHGVIVMERVSRILERKYAELEDIQEKLESRFNKRGINMCDLHRFNFGKDAKGRVKIMDFGYSYI